MVSETQCVDFLFFCITLSQIMIKEGGKQKKKCRDTLMTHASKCFDHEPFMVTSNGIDMNVRERMGLKNEIDIAITESTIVIIWIHMAQ